MASVAKDGLVAQSASIHDLVIDFMFLDLETCSRCRATDANLDAALAEVGHILAMAGRDVAVRKTLVASVAQARALGFVSSPTIRVNGKDIALELRESACQECGDACGCGDINCRVWDWQGQEHTAAPKGMIVDAVLREISSGAGQAVVPVPAAATPEHLERFFAGRERLQAEPSACCAPAEQTSCCEPSQKASCCGDTSGGGCGCQ